MALPKPTSPLRKPKSAEVPRRIVATPKIGADGLFVQQDTRGWTNKEKAEHELEENHNRERFASKFNYADPFIGNTRTFDEDGRYNCGACNQAQAKRCLIIGELVQIDLEAGSCYGWENLCAGDPELDFGPKGVSDAEAMAYGVAKNGKGFGCGDGETGEKCPWASTAYEPDSRGRKLYCGKGNMRVYFNACCKLNGKDVENEYEGNKAVKEDKDDY
jgi:hypothetical protein